MPPKAPGPWIPHDLRLPLATFADPSMLALEQELGGAACWALWKLKARVAQTDLSGTFWGDQKRLAIASGWPVAKAAALVEALEQSDLIEAVDGGWKIIGWTEEQAYIVQHEQRSRNAASAIEKRWRAKASAQGAPYQQNTSGIPTEYHHGTDGIPESANGIPHTSTSPVPVPNQASTKPSQRETEPKGSCVPQAAHAAPQVVDADLDSLWGEPSPPAPSFRGRQEGQQQASSTPQGQSHPRASVGGLPGPPVELSTKAYPPAFEALWKSAPQVARTRSGKPKAYAAWSKACKVAQPEAIATGLEAFKASWDWRKDGGAYVPGLHLWLGREVWDERPSTVEPAPKPSYAPQMGAVRGGALLRVAEAQARLDAKRLAEQAVTVEVEVVS